MKKFITTKAHPELQEALNVDLSIVRKSDCKDCGEEMEWQECWSCGGEGGRDWEDLQFEDPLWYSPDDFIECDECAGKGGMWICPNKNCG